MIAGRDGASGQRRVSLSEVHGWYLAQLTVFKGGEREFEDQFTPIFGVLPSTVGIPISAHRVTLLRTAIDQYWLLTGDDRFDVYVLRTFAACIWDWLIDAALPFGYNLKIETLGATAQV